MPCTNCMAKYTVLKKEHGCSNCGYGFCQKCLTNKFLLPRLSNKPVPVCDGCYKSLSGETVQPLEKSRHETNKSGENWWGDGKPPPSMRHQYPIKPKTLNDKGPKLSDAEKDAQMAERLAKVMNKTVDEVKNPRYMVSDRDEGNIPTSSAGILSNLRQPSNPPTIPVHKAATPNHDDKLSNLPKPPPDSESIEGLEERLAALRNVPVEMIRKPRLMVMNDSDSEPELNDDAKELLQSAEQKLRKKEPDLFYDNDALDSD